MDCFIKSEFVGSFRLCGGLIADMKRRAPWYWSDFKDALNPQCIASIIFIYFACLTPIITFGGVMGTKTGKNMVCFENKILIICIIICLRMWMVLNGLLRNSDGFAH